MEKSYQQHDAKNLALSYITNPLTIILANMERDK